MTQGSNDRTYRRIIVAVANISTFSHIIFVVLYLCQCVPVSIFPPPGKKRRKRKRKSSANDIPSYRRCSIGMLMEHVFPLRHSITPFRSSSSYVMRPFSSCPCLSFTGCISRDRSRLAWLLRLHWAFSPPCFPSCEPLRFIESPTETETTLIL